jgi:hypothetical protein
MLRPGSRKNPKTSKKKAIFNGVGFGKTPPEKHRVDNGKD